MTAGLEQVLETVGAALPPGFPARIWDPIAAGMRRQARQFLRSAESGARA